MATTPPKTAEEKDLGGRDMEGHHARHASAALQALDLVKQHDQHHPVHWPSWKKWAITSVYCLLQVFVTLTSTTYVSAETAIQEKFGGSTQVVTLGQSMFIVGNAVGPAFLGPLS